MTLRFKLSSITIVVVVIPLLVLGIISYLISSTSLEKVIEESLIVTTTQSAFAVEESLNKVKVATEVLSADKIFSDYLMDSKSEEFKNEVFMKLNNSYKAMSEIVDVIYFANNKGKIVMSSSDINASIDISDRGYYKEVLTGSLAISDVLVSRDTGNALIVVAYPIFDKNSKVLGTIFSAVGFDSLLGYIKAVKIGETGYVYMIDKTGTFLYHPVPEKMFVESLLDTPSESLKDYATQIISKESMLGEYTYEGVEKLAASQKVNNWTVVTTINRSDYLKPINSLRTGIILIVVISFLVVLVISIWIGLQISKPVVNIANGIKEISEGDGDLTKTITAKHNDETGLLAQSFNKFVSNLNGIVTNIKNSSHKNSSISTDLNSSSANASSAANEIKISVESIQNQIQNLDNNINETTSGIQEIGTNIVQFKSQVDEQVSAVEESSASIEEMIASLDNVAGVTNKKLESTRLLVETTKKGEDVLSETSILFKEGIADKIGNIKDMVEVISEISTRTNLLAMNAAIEAAHAGEAGKGFAVVADEIRKMAEESAQSSSSIGEIINIIVKAIVDTDAYVDKTATAFRDISLEVKGIDVALNEIASSTIELASGGQEILKSVTLLNDTTTQIAGGIKDIEVSAEQISHSMVSVQNNSNEVNIGVKDIQNRIHHVSTSFDEVNELSTKLDQESRKLLAEVDKFIV